MKVKITPAGKKLIITADTEEEWELMDKWASNFFSGVVILRGKNAPKSTLNLFAPKEMATNEED